MANSSYYGVVSGQVTTISRAVVVMGFDAVKRSALGMLMFKHMKKKDGDSEDIKEETISSLLKGVYAKQMAEEMGKKQSEEAFVCAMFRNIGKLIILFYFPKEAKRAQEISKKDKIPLSRAIKQILGVTYLDIGKELGKDWNFPAQVLRTMEPLPSKSIGKPKNKLDKLHQITEFSNELGEITKIENTFTREKALDNLKTTFSPAFKISKKQLDNLFRRTVDELEEHAKLLGINVDGSPLVKNLIKISGKALEKAIAAQAEGSDESPIPLSSTPSESEIKLREAILSAGISNLNNSVKSYTELNQLMITVLKTIHRGLGFHRVIFCYHELSSKIMSAHIGFGERIEGIIPKFRYTMHPGPDIFNYACFKGKDIIVKDITSEGRRIPKWYTDLLNSPTFFLFPLLVKKIPVGLLYGDYMQSDINIDRRLQFQMRSLRDSAARIIGNSGLYDS